MHVSWCMAGFGRGMGATAAPARRGRTTVARSLILLATAFALGACGSTPRPRLSVPAPQGDGELRSLLDAAPADGVAGTPVNAELLSHFYERHGFRPVWTTRPEQAGALLDAVQHAGDQGLDPEMFHAGVLLDGADLSPVERDVLLSDAVLSYADALARGAVPIERRRDDEVLTPEPVDVAAVLEEAIDSPDPAAAVEALAPTTPTYLALRQALQKARARAQAGDKGAADRLRKIVVNLERQRWLPRQLPADRVWVNVADERLMLYRDNKPVFSTRVVVGQDLRHNQSPEFGAVIDASYFNPPWVIPTDIVKAEILPEIGRDPDYLSRNKMVMLTSGEVEQLPGPEAGLGLIMFDMPNKFDVYLHDTPNKQVFDRDNRRISHGCIRVQHPRELAALLLQQSLDMVDEGIAAGGTTRNALPSPVPVFVVYQTAAVDADGTLQFYPDFYNRDAGIWRKLQTVSGSGGATVHADSRRPSAAPPS